MKIIKEYDENYIKLKQILNTYKYNNKNKKLKKNIFRLNIIIHLKIIQLYIISKIILIYHFLCY